MKVERSRLTFALVLPALAVLVLGASLALAGEVATQADSTAPPTAEPDAEGMPVSVAGMTVWIDPDTGQLRQPTAEEAAALSAAMQRMFAAAERSPSTFAKTTRTDGSVVVNVGLGLLDFSVATVGADGEVAFHCLDSAHSASDHVHDRVETQEEK